MLDIEERNENNRATSYFRTSLDFVMGVIYAFIGVMVMYFHSFGNVALDPAICYIFGPLVIIYGFFRIGRGIKGSIPPKRKDYSSRK